MKRTIFNTLATACAVLFGVMPLVSSCGSAERAPSTPIVSDFYYGREQLSSLPNSVALLYAYDQIVSGMARTEMSISVYDGVHPISRKEINTVFDTYMRDHAEHFWTDGAYSMRYNSETVLSVEPVYTVTGEDLNRERAAFTAAMETMTRDITDEMSDFEKERILHDRLAAFVRYQNGNHAHDAYGALVGGASVCEGYAEAFQSLLHSVGIRSFLVSGDTVEGRHKWNLVCIDGTFSYVDLTWNDQTGDCFHAYFNATDKDMADTHTADKLAFPLPACTDPSKSYFKVMGGRLGKNGYTVEKIAEALVKNGLTAHFYAEDGAQMLISWCNDHLREIADACGITGSCSVSYKTLGREVVVTVIAMNG